MENYKKFRELLANKNKEAIKKFIENADAAELSGLILPRITDNNAGKILGDILKYFGTTDRAQSNRCKLVEAVLKSLRKVSMPNSHVNNLITRIIHDFPKYSKVQLVRLVDYCVDCIRSNNDDFFSWRDLLPVLLQILEEEKYIDRMGTEVSGPEYKSLIIKSICNQQWDNAILTSLAMMFASIRMETADHDIVIRTICHKIPDIEHRELPPLVYQLLKLSNNNDNKLVIGCLQKFFTNLYKQAPEETPDSVTFDGIVKVSLREIRETESTVLYHIRQAVVLNHSCIRDFVRYLKTVTNAPEYVLHPFPMAVMLQVTDIYEDQLFDIIKQAITRKITDDNKRYNSAWLREILPETWEIMDILNQIIENGNKDRHLVIKGLLDLAFVLLDTKPIGEDNSLHEIGIQVIQKLMKKRHEIGKFVLERLSCKIMDSSGCVSQYTECLAYMCRRATLIVLDSQVWISTLLDNLLVIPGEAARQVLYATLPLMKSSTSIRDSLVLILRKVLYRPGIEVRQMGVSGFLQFLTNLRIPQFSLSQCNSSASQSGSIFTQATVERSQQRTQQPRNNAAFCNEILGILQRCFTHESEVRQHLYRGLQNAVASNVELAEHVIEMLLTHLKGFYEADEDVKPPLKFHNCSNINKGPEAVLEEPIGDLIFALQRIYCQVAAKDLHSVDQLSMVLESLCRRMTQTELEYFYVDDGTDLLDNVPKAQQKVICIKLAVTTLEALIAFRINSWNTNDANVASNVKSLFKTYHEIVEFTKRITKTKKGDGKKNKDKNDTTINKKYRKAIKLPHTVIDVETVKKMIVLLYSPNVDWATKDQTAVLQKLSKFHVYVLNVLRQIIADTKQKKHFERHMHKEKYKRDYIEIGELLYKEVISNLEQTEELDEDVFILCLECFRDLVDLISGNFHSEFPLFLSKLCGIDVIEGLQTQINALIKALRNLIQQFYESEVDKDSPKHKIPLVLFEIVLLIVTNTSQNQLKLDSTFRWLLEVAKEEKVTPIVLIILQLITIIEEKQADEGRVLNQMSMELCKKFGTINNAELTIEEVHKIFNDDTIAQAHVIFNNALKNKINNFSWALGRLKSEQIVSSTMWMNDDGLRDALKTKERSFCRHLAYAGRSLELLANACVDPGPITDGTFKNLQQLYSVLSNLTRYFSSKSTPQNPAFQDVKFIQVVQLAGKPLKTNFYNLITHTEENQIGGRRADVHAMKNKVLKETKFIPKVVFEIEQFNKEILALGRKTGIPLDSYIKHSITRDFRIKHEELAEGLERMDVTSGNTQSTSTPMETDGDDGHLPLENDESDSEAPPVKKPRNDSEEADTDDDDVDDE